MVKQSLQAGIAPCHFTFKTYNPTATTLSFSVSVKIPIVHSPLPSKKDKKLKFFRVALLWWVTQRMLLVAAYKLKLFSFYSLFSLQIKKVWWLVCKYQIHQLFLPNQISLIEISIIDHFTLEPGYNNIFYFQVVIVRKMTKWRMLLREKMLFSNVGSRLPSLQTMELCIGFEAPAINMTMWP